MAHRTSHHRQEGGPDHMQINNAIGQPLYFDSGQFKGQTIRAELEELQKADSGRKYARVDRRPLDPPPAVRLRLFQVSNGSNNASYESEVVYEDVSNVGIICSVDLFPVPDLIVSDPSTYSPQWHSTSTSNYPGSARRNPHSTQPLTFFPLHPFSSALPDGAQPRTSPFSIPRRQPMLGQLLSEPPPDAVLRIGNHLVTESSKLTPALIGEKFVEPTLVEYQGEKALVFVFGDLAVQREGMFILRYRAFDIFSTVAGSQYQPIMAELYGGAFKVYSTREFPGLEPSTELTRSLAAYGVRVTLRDTERRSKKRHRDANSGANSSTYRIMKGAGGG